jgi:hypothetical protein
MHCSPHTCYNICQAIEARSLHLSESFGVRGARDRDVWLVPIEANGAFAHCAPRPVLADVDATLTDQQHRVRCEMIYKQHVFKRVAPL